MQVNVNGMWTEVPDAAVPQTLGWDDTLSANPNALGDNRGCPPGYFCEYVSGTFGGYERVCRRFDQQIAGNPAVLQAETGPGLYEQTQINIASAASTAVGVLGTGLGISGGLLLLLGAAYMLLTSHSGGGYRRNPRRRRQYQSVATVNRYLKSKGIRERLHYDADDQHFHFYGGKSMKWYRQGVYGYSYHTAMSFPLSFWLKERNALAHAPENRR